MLVGAAIGSFGALVVSHDFPEWMSRHPLFNVGFLFLGIGGVFIYLAKAIFTRFLTEVWFRILVLVPFVGVTAMMVATGSPMLAAWSVSSLIFAGLSVLSEEGLKDESDLLIPYAIMFLLVLGGWQVFHEVLDGHRHFSPVGYMSLFVGVICTLAYVRGGKGYHGAIRFVASSGVLLAALYAFVSGHPPLHIILLVPLGLILLFSPVFERMRFGQVMLDSENEEQVRIRQFQDVTEVNAWAVFLFALIHVFLNPDLGGYVIFGLFIVALVSFIYQYRISESNRTYRGFHAHSTMNLSLLAVVAHFTGGLESLFNWFFVLTLLSSVVGSKAGPLKLKLGIITVFYIVETGLSVAAGKEATSIIVDTVLVEYFMLLVAGLYIFRITNLQSSLDARLASHNEELVESLGREREAVETVVSQSVELRAAQEQLRTILTSVGDAVIAVDAKGQVILVNEAASTIYQVIHPDRESGPVGQTVGEAFPFTSDTRVEMGLPTFPEAVKMLLQGEDIKGVEMYHAGAEGDGRRLLVIPEDAHLKHDDKKIYVEGLLAIFDDAVGDVAMVLTFRDVTYRREVENLKNSFMSVAAHQLRTPLSSIRWFLELLRDSSEGKLKKNQKMFADNAYISLLRMIGLVNGLLAVTRVEASRVPSHPEPISVPSMTEQILKEFKGEIDRKELSVHVKSYDEIPEIPLDPQLSREVFLNLISNAVRYSERGGDIIISMGDDGEVLRWSIQDNGIGIPERQQVKIFQKFYRASNAAKKESKGTGLGLYLARFIARKWGGDITFESEEGKGTTFHVTVPHTGMESHEGEVSLHA